MSEITHLPTIVAVGYNRLKSIERLTQSLLAASYLNESVRLVICLDRADDTSVFDFAEQLNWPFGEKKVILQTEHCGLKEHILRCGDLTKTYGSIILLEDDLIVSPYFYHFAVQAQAFYGGTDQIAGISLYHYEITENGFFPFFPMEDGTDVYFLQFASSWGQLWTDRMWKTFRAWFAENPDYSKFNAVPPFMEGWSENSWKKHYIQFLVETDRYFVFPRKSLSTNFTDPGTNAETFGLFQVPLEQGRVEYQFKPLGKSLAIYDCSFEPKTAILHQKQPDLAAYDVEIDLYATKNPKTVDRPYLLTTRKCKSAIRRYGLELVPAVENVFQEVPGDQIVLCKTEDVNLDANPAAYDQFYRLRSIIEHTFEPLVNSKVAVLEKEIWRDANAKIAEINQEAKERIDSKIQGFIENFEFQQAFPKIGIVVVNRDQNQLAENTLKSILQQQYPNLDLLFLSESETASSARFLEISQKEVHCKRQSGSAINAGLHAFFDGTEAKILCWLEAGDLLLDQALSAVAKIFRKFPDLGLLSGLPVLLNKDGSIISTTNLTDVRINADRIGYLGDDLLSRFQNASIFFTKHLWLRAHREQPGLKDQFDQSSLWLSFVRCTDLHPVCAALGGKLHSPESVPPKSIDQLEYFKSRFSDQSGLRNFIWKISYAAFSRDLPILRFFHQEISPYPDVIRFDHQHDSYYMSRY